MDFKEERNMILDMVAEGRITVDDAKQLLDALEKSASKKNPDDEFFVSPGMDFHIPEVRIPNVNHIINRATRRSMPGFVMHSSDLEDLRENLEDEMERLREQLEILKEEAGRIAEEIKEQAREHNHHGEDRGS